MKHTVQVTFGKTAGTIDLEVKLDQLAVQLASRIFYNKTGRSRLLKGAIVARATNIREVTP